MKSQNPDDGGCQNCIRKQGLDELQKGIDFGILFLIFLFVMYILLDLLKR